MGQRLMIVLTGVNVALLVSCIGLRDGRQVLAEDVAPVLRGRALEIVDDSGRVRASIRIAPADPTYQMPDGTKGYPETVLFRLMDPEGRPNVKIGASERGSGQLISGDSDPTYVRILAEGGRPSITVSNKDGKVQMITP
ncbi:MAG TPA: hypothetical protein VKA21_05810 [Candidatus Binatia bacterium]|nr:hypothetical protein [Candidatus Binatia bacterium]